MSCFGFIASAFLLTSTPNDDPRYQTYFGHGGGSFFKDRYPKGSTNAGISVWARNTLPNFYFWVGPKTQMSAAHAILCLVGNQCECPPNNDHNLNAGRIHESMIDTSSRGETKSLAYSMIGQRHCDKLEPLSVLQTFLIRLGIVDWRSIYPREIQNDWGFIHLPEAHLFREGYEMKTRNHMEPPGPDQPVSLHFGERPIVGEILVYGGVVVLGLMKVIEVQGNVFRMAPVDGTSVTQNWHSGMPWFRVNRETEEMELVGVHSSGDSKTTSWGVWTGTEAMKEQIQEFVSETGAEICGFNAECLPLRLPIPLQRLRAFHGLEEFRE